MIFLLLTTAAYYISGEISALLLVLLLLVPLVLPLVVKVKGAPLKYFFYFFAFGSFLSGFLYCFLFFLDRNFIDEYGYVHPPSWAFEKSDFLTKELVALREEIATCWKERYN